jgi:hypothetical protein
MSTIVIVMKSKSMRGVAQVAEKGNAHRVLVGEISR